MAIRNAPRKRLLLETVYAEQGGVRSFVLGRLNAGDRVEDIAEKLTAASEESVSRRTLYRWISKWQGDEKQKMEGAGA